MSGEVLRRNGIEAGKPACLKFENGMVVEGLVVEILRSRSGKVILLELQDARMQYDGKIIISAPSYTMAVGAMIISAYAGPADTEAFQPTVRVPHEKMHKIVYDDRALQLHELYRVVRQARNEFELISRLPSVWKTVVHDFPNDWLLTLEILEILEHHPSYQQHCDDLRLYLERKREQNPHLDKLITNGLKLLKLESPRFMIN
jgi:phenylalanine-4-hydroxylase